MTLFSFSVRLQNLCFILPQFLYQFFCGCSQQVSISNWGSKTFWTWKEVVFPKITPLCAPGCSALVLTIPFPHCPWDACTLLSSYNINRQNSCRSCCATTNTPWHNMDILESWWHLFVFLVLEKKIKIGEKSYGNSLEHKDSFYYSYDICRPF